MRCIPVPRRPRPSCAQEADYLLVVKANQPTLYAECAAYFSDPTARVGRATTVDRRRGRTETRTLYVDDLLEHPPPPLQPLPAHPAGGLPAHARSQDRRGTHREVRFLLTSLTPHQAAPARLLALARGHWSIESRHFVRDVTFGEDRSPLRSGDAPQIMAACRNLAHTLIRRTGTTAIAAARRAFSYHPARALALLLALP